MKPARKTTHRFADFAFDASSGELYRGDRRVPLRPQASQVLERLLRRPGELVHREELRHLLWGDAAVDAEAGINHCIRQVRRALADSAPESRFIATEPRRGYRFIAAVRSEETGGTSEGSSRRGPAGAEESKQHPWLPRADRAGSKWRGWAAVAVVAGVAVALLAAGQRPSPMPEAADLTGEIRADYQRARYLLRQLDAPSAGRAVPLLERVTQRAPDFAAGHAALARAVLQADPTTPGTVARHHVRRALQISPMHAEALVVRGDIRGLIDRDWSAAERDFRRARQADPGLVDALHHHAGLRAVLGDDRGAIGLMHEALEMDPVSPLLAGDLAWFYFVARDWSAARSWARRTLELEPDWAGARSVLLHASARSGDADEVRRQAVATLRAAQADAAAIELVQRAADPLQPYWSWWSDRLAGATDPASRVHRAWTYGARGRIDAAIGELAALQATSYRPLLFLVRDPRFDPLRKTPHFAALLDHLGVPAAAPLVVHGDSSLRSSHERE